MTELERVDATQRQRAGLAATTETEVKERNRRAFGAGQTGSVRSVSAAIVVAEDVGCPVLRFAEDILGNGSRMLSGNVENEPTDSNVAHPKSDTAIPE